MSGSKRGYYILGSELLLSLRKPGCADGARWCAQVYFVCQRFITECFGGVKLLGTMNVLIFVSSACACSAHELPYCLPARPYSLIGRIFVNAACNSIRLRVAASRTSRGARPTTSSECSLASPRNAATPEPLEYSYSSLVARLALTNCPLALTHLSVLHSARGCALVHCHRWTRILISWSCSKQSILCQTRAPVSCEFNYPIVRNPHSFLRLALQKS